MAGVMTIETGGVESTLEELGLSDPHLSVRNMTAGEFTVDHSRAAADVEPLFAYGAAIKVRVGRVKENGVWSGGTKVFTGRRVLSPVSGSGAAEDVTYTFANAWHQLERINYGVRWAKWVRKEPLTPVVYDRAYEVFSDYYLHTRVDTTQNTVTRITNGEQVRDAVAWAISCGVSLQIGTISPALYLPPDFKTDLKVAEVIRLCLKLTPDAVCYIDEATEPPTFHCVRRAEMTPVNIALDAEKIDQLRLTRRDDLVVPAVVLKYRRVDEIDGVSKSLPPLVDAWPADATGFEEGAVVQTIQLEGARVSNVYGTIETEELPDNGGLAPGDKEWWIAHGKTWLGAENITEVFITPSERTGSLPNVVLPESGAIAAWMVDDGGNPAEVETETLSATVSYITAASQPTKSREELITVRLKTTNLASGTYKAVKSIEDGELAVAGLAQEIFNGLAVPHYDGDIVVVEEECAADITLLNTVNVTGGTGRFASMNAVVQQIAYDFHSGTRTLTVGWPKQLSADDLIELVRFNRVRRTWNNPEVQVSGESGPADDVELPDHLPMEDNVDGPPTMEAETFESSSAGTAYVHLDGSTGRVLVAPKPAGAAKALGGTPAATGKIDLVLADCGGLELKIITESACVNVGGVKATKYRKVLASPWQDSPP